jgi:pyrophosphatase PpaX
MQKKKTVLFDVDGTLMDSHGMVTLCFMHLFEKYGDPKDFTPELQREVFGPPLHVEMKKLFPQQDPDRMVEEYRVFQKTHDWKGVVTLFPGVEEVLETLHREGYPMGIVSSRLSASCREWMELLGIINYFEVILGREMFDKAKPEPDGIIDACRLLGTEPENSIYIGDNASDVIAAKRAGAAGVGFISDEDKRQEVIDAQPDLIITEMRDLLDFVRKQG